MEDLPKTYASALLELAEKHNALDDVHTDIDTLLVRTEDINVATLSVRNMSMVCDCQMAKLACA